MKKYVFILAALLSCMAVTAKDVVIKLYQTTDVHGSYFPYDFIKRKPTGGGLARVSTVVSEARNVYGDNVILLDNGDILQGQPTVYYYNYIDTVSPHIASEIMNFMGYDAGTVGNHDVETGRHTLDRWAEQCEMPILGANIIDVATGQPHFTPYTVIERGGVRIAVLGLLTPAIPAWLPEVLWKGLRFDDMEETARKWIPIIKEKERPDVVVGLFHAGQSGNMMLDYKENPSLEIAAEVPGFDLVLIGHDHIRDSKKIVNVEGDTVLVMNPANNAEYLTDVTLRFKLDDDGVVVDRDIEGGFVKLSDYMADATFIGRFMENVEVIDDYVNEYLGVITDTISTRGAFFGPSEFVDLIHELQLGLSGADISFVAPLSFDAMIPAGDIRMSDVFNLYVGFPENRTD